VETGLLPTFEWQDSFDPDGGLITYTLWYDTTTTFETRIEIPGLTSPQHTPDTDLLDNSIYYWKKGQAPVIDPGSSIGRFIRAAQMIEGYPAQKEGEPIKYAFEILNTVSARRTVWSIVYDNIKMKIHFRTRASSKLRTIDMTRLDYACQTPVQCIDINAQLSGDITSRLEIYTKQKNRDLVENAFRKTSFLKNTSKAALDRLADFAGTMMCKP
jgi:hypothetical protein